MSTLSPTTEALSATNNLPEKRRGICLAIGDLLDKPTGDLLNRGKRRRLKALVRGGSVRRASLRDFFQPFNRNDHGKIMKGAERLEIITKVRGKRNGALGYTGIRVLKALLEFIDYRSGRLEPSYLALCKKTGLCVSAVAEALKRLVAHGFLDLQRRYEETGNTEGGPTVRQITNAYRIMLPVLAAKTLRSTPPAPLSDDEIWHRKVQREERERMICQLPDWEQPVARANLADSSLEAALLSLSRALCAANQPVA